MKLMGGAMKLMGGGYEIDRGGLLKLIGGGYKIEGGPTGTYGDTPQHCTA